jgi:hypothetical protein
MVSSSIRTAIDAGPSCGGTLTAERWTSETSAVRQSTDQGITLRVVVGVPEWAAPYALQGETCVTRYLCP